MGVSSNLDQWVGMNLGDRQCSRISITTKCNIDPTNLEIVSRGRWTILDEAQENAEGFGGNLAIIDGIIENGGSQRHFSMPQIMKLILIGTAWIGLTDSKLEGVWIDLESSGFTNWSTISSSPEPNGGIYNYAEITLGGIASSIWGWQVGGWNDAPSNQDRNSHIIEIPLNLP